MASVYLASFHSNFLKLWISGRKENSQRPFKALRYFHRQLLKPTDVPQIRDQRLKLELYRRHGHPYTTIAGALEAHLTCRVIGAAERISRWTSLPLNYCCLLTGILLTLVILAGLEMFLLLQVIHEFILLPCLLSTILSTCSHLYSMQTIWRYERIIETSLLPIHMVRYYILGEDLPSDVITRLEAETELSWTNFFGFMCGVAFVGGIVFAEHNMERIVSSLKRRYMEWRYRESEVCAICYTEKRTRCFQPCGHLVCCGQCADELLECPICKEFILAEHTTPPSPPRALPATPTSEECRVCRAPDRTQSRRILVPCGHVIGCVDGCARLLDDCPSCWEEVTDDRNVYQP